MRKNFVVAVACTEEYEEIIRNVIYSNSSEFNNFNGLFTAWVVFERGTEISIKEANKMYPTEIVVKFYNPTDNVREYDAFILINYGADKNLDGINEDNKLSYVRCKFETELIYHMLHTELYLKHIGEKLHNNFHDLYAKSIISLKEAQYQNPYHNIIHCVGVMNNLFLRYTKKSDFTPYNNIKLYSELLAAYYHDYMYDPRLDTFENLKVATEGVKRSEFLVDNDHAEFINHIITESDTKGKGRLYISDISHWCRKREEIIEIEKLIFKEFAWVDFTEYKRKRIEILKKISKNLMHFTTIYGEYEIAPIISGINFSIDWLKSFQPKIGWFCGSFYPFHIGHKNILDKAEKIFDKVVIVKAKNHFKKIDHELTEYYGVGQKSDLSLTREVIYCDGLISDLIIKAHKNGYVPTLIRGYRNYQDVVDSDIWIEQVNELIYDEEVKRKVEMVLIRGDVEFNHISSTFLRQLNKVGGHDSLYFQYTFEI